MDKRKVTTGNTLDFYNEDMSRKAVGKLFDGMEPENNDAAVAYSDIEDVSQAHSPQSEQYSMEHQVFQQSNRYPEAFVTNPEPAESVISKVSFDDLGLNEKDSSYRRRGADKMSDRMSESGSYKRISELPYTQKASQSSQQPKIATVPRSTTSHQPRVTTESRKYVANDNKFNDQYADTMYDDGSQKIVKYVAAGALFVFIIILFLLILKINGLQKQLTGFDERLVKIEENADPMDSLRIQISGIKDDVSNLQSLVADIGDRTTAQPEQDDVPTPTPTPSSPPANTGTTPPQTGTNESGNRTYTVQSGDTLSKISEKFYGSASQYSKIKEANSLTSDSLKVGQTLIIP